MFSGAVGFCFDLLISYRNGVYNTKLLFFSVAVTSGRSEAHSHLMMHQLCQIMCILLTASQTQLRRPTSKDPVSTVVLLLCQAPFSLCIPFFHSLTRGQSHGMCVRVCFSLTTAPTVIRGEGHCLQWFHCSTAWLKYGFSRYQDRHRDSLNFIGYCATGVCLRDPFPFLPAPGQQRSLLQQRPQGQPKSNPGDPKTCCIRECCRCLEA